MLRVTEPRVGDVPMRVIAGLLVGLIGSVGRAETPNAQASCPLDRFSPNPSEHVVSEIPSPLRVRRVQGTIRSAVGEWPKGTTVRFEVLEPTVRGKLWKGVAKRSGRFSISSVPDGEYCFRAMAIGWQSVVGRVVVSSDRPGKEIDLTLDLGI
jgi:hypothetical protein